MGSFVGHLCQDLPLTTLLDQTVSNKFDSYEIVNWPEDQFFSHKIDQIKNKGFKDNYEQLKLMKHKTSNQYYLGEWDQDGNQKGQGIRYKPHQYIYYGNFDSVPQGKGVLQSLTDKFTYEGEFDHGKIEGHGKLYSHQNLFQFQGTIHNKIPTHGTLTVRHLEETSQQYKVHTINFDNYPENKAKILFPNDREYTGDINTTNFVPNGYGVSNYFNNSVYQGQWENGQFHGKGKFTWPDGSSYEGQYLAGKKHGTGKFIYYSKKAYDGEWVNGKQQGKGVLLSPSGEIIKRGYWKDGVYERESE